MSEGMTDGHHQTPRSKIFVIDHLTYHLSFLTSLSNPLTNTPCLFDGARS